MTLAATAPLYFTIGSLSLIFSRAICKHNSTAEGFKRFQSCGRRCKKPIKSYFEHGRGEKESVCSGIFDHNTQETARLNLLSIKLTHVFVALPFASLKQRGI